MTKRTDHPPAYVPPPRDIPLPPNEFQPSKADMNAEIDMPGISDRTTPHVLPAVQLHARRVRVTRRNCDSWISPLLLGRQSQEETKSLRHSPGLETLARRATTSGKGPLTRGEEGGVECRQ